MPSVTSAASGIIGILQVGQFTTGDGAWFGIAGLPWNGKPIPSCDETSVRNIAYEIAFFRAFGLSGNHVWQFGGTLRALRGRSGVHDPGPAARKRTGPPGLLL